jgi:hypothetical protein
VNAMIRLFKPKAVTCALYGSFISLRFFPSIVIVFDSLLEVYSSHTTLNTIPLSLSPSLNPTPLPPHNEDSEQDAPSDGEDVPF